MEKGVQGNPYPCIAFSFSVCPPQAPPMGDLNDMQEDVLWLCLSKFAFLPVDEEVMCVKYNDSLVSNITVLMRLMKNYEINNERDAILTSEKI